MAAHLSHYCASFLFWSKSKHGARVNISKERGWARCTEIIIETTKYCEQSQYLNKMGDREGERVEDRGCLLCVLCAHACKCAQRCAKACKCVCEMVERGSRGRERDRERDVESTKTICHLLLAWPTSISVPMSSPSIATRR